MESSSREGVVFMSALLTTAVAVLAVVLWWNKQSNKTGASKDKTKQISSCAVPGMKPSDEELGNLADMGKAGSLHQFMMNLHSEFGPLASFWWGKQQALSIASPDLFKQHSKVFDRPASLFLMFEPLVTKHSIQYANGADGQKRHTAYMRCYSHEVLVDYVGILNEIAEELANKWLKAVDTNEQVNLREACFNLAIKAITRTSYGELFKDDAEINNLTRHYDEAMGEMEARLGGSIPPAGSQREIELKNSTEGMVDVVRKAMVMRRQTQDTARHMLIDVMMESDFPEEVQLADAISVLMGGFHTSGSLLTWCFYFLARHQDIQDRVVQELNEVLQQDPVSIHTMPELVYLRQVVDETLRASVLAPYAARFSEEEITLGGYTVPPGMPVVHALGVTLQDEKLWPNPERFDPDRFSPENRRKMSHFYFEPFGFSGGRKCPGYRFAYTEITFAVATILKKVKIKLVDENLNVTPVFGFVTHQKETVMVHFEKRQPHK